MAKKGEVLFKTQGADVLSTGNDKYDNFFMRHRKAISFSGVNYIKMNPLNPLGGIKAVNEKTIDLSKYLRQEGDKTVLKIWNGTRGDYEIATVGNNTGHLLELNGLKSDGTFSSATEIEWGNYGRSDIITDVTQSLRNNSTSISSKPEKKQTPSTRGIGSTSTSGTGK